VPTRPTTKAAAAPEGDKLLCFKPLLDISIASKKDRVTLMATVSVASML
jgi:hypothetical protein